MSAADFQNDLRFTEQARSLIVRDLYPKLTKGRGFVSVNGSAGSLWLQKNAHIDAVLQVAPNRSVTVEEKIVRQKYSAFTIETHSVLESGERNGWIYASTADWLLYAFCVPGGLECWFMALPSLREWFALHETRYRHCDTLNRFLNGTMYHTRCRIVPIRDIACQKWLYSLTKEAA